MVGMTKIVTVKRSHFLVPLEGRMASVPLAEQLQPLRVSSSLSNVDGNSRQCVLRSSASQNHVELGTSVSVRSLFK